MTQENAKVEKETPALPLDKRAIEFARRAWRPTGTVVAVTLALLLMWHVVNGKNGLTVWHQKRSADKQLKREIDQLEQENARLRQHVPGVLAADPRCETEQDRKTGPQQA